MRSRHNVTLNEVKGAMLDMAPFAALRVTGGYDTVTFFAIP